MQTTPASPPPTSPPATNPPTPSNAFTLPAKGKPNTKKGSLRLSITLPGAGTLTYLSSGKALIKPGNVTITSLGPTQVNLAPSKAAEKKLKRAAKGKLRVRIKFTYTPTGGTANTQTRSYILTRK